MCYYFLQYDVDWGSNVFVEFHGVAKIKKLISHHMERASVVEIIILTNNVSVVRSDVSVLTSPGYLIQNIFTLCHIFPSIIRYIVVGQKKNSVCDFHPFSDSLG